MERVLNDNTRLYLEVTLSASPLDYLHLESRGFSRKGCGGLSEVVGLRSLHPSLQPLSNCLGRGPQAASPRVGGPGRLVSSLSAL